MNNLKIHLRINPLTPSPIAKVLTLPYRWPMV